MQIEKKLKSLFEYQRFENDPRLAAMIAGAESKRKIIPLCDSELELVTAAGELPPKDVNGNGY